MYLRLNGSKIRSAFRVEPPVPVFDRGATMKSGVSARWMGARSLGFVYVIRSEHGLVKVGASSDPLATIAQLRRESPYRLYVDYIAFTRADVSAEVLQAAFEALVRHRVQREWCGCAPEDAITAIQSAAKILGYRMVPVNFESVGQILSNASRISVTRHGLIRWRPGYGEVVIAGLLGVMGLLTLNLSRIYLNFNLHPSIDLFILAAMIAAIVMDQQRRATGRM